MKKLVASDMSLATSWKKPLKSIFSSLRPLEETLPNGPSGPRAEWRVNSEPPEAAENCAGRIYFARALKCRRVERPAGAEPKKKDTTCVVSFFLVPVTGLEPVRCRQRWILSPLRLPIPSHRQIGALPEKVRESNPYDTPKRRRLQGGSQNTFKVFAPPHFPALRR